MGLKQLTSLLFWSVRSRGRVRGRRFYISPTTSIRFEDGAVLRLGRDVHVSGGGALTIRATTTLGDGVFIGRNTTLVAFAPISVGRRTLIAENVSIHSENHRGADLGRFSASPITIGDGCWVGAGAVLTEGTRIGAGTVIGANAVVRGTLPPGVVAAGAPARVIKSRTDVPT